MFENWSLRNNLWCTKFRLQISLAHSKRTRNQPLPPLSRKLINRINDNNNKIKNDSSSNRLNDSTTTTTTTMIKLRNSKRSPQRRQQQQILTSAKMSGPVERVQFVRICPAHSGAPVRLVSRAIQRLNASVSVHFIPFDSIPCHSMNERRKKE